MKGGMITRINNELKAIEENFSIEELFLKHGIISLMFYEPLEFQQLIWKGISTLILRVDLCLSHFTKRYI